MTTVVRFLAVLIASVVGLLGSGAVAAAVSNAPPAMYTYDSHNGSAELTSASAERGPPILGGSTVTLNGAVDRPPGGGWARQSTATTPTITTYDYSVMLVQAVGVGHITDEPGGSRAGTPAPFLRGGVAAKTGGVGPVRVGQAGEDAVRSAYQIGDKTPFNVLGRDRIADGMTATTISEVKNVGYQGYSQQLKDYVTYSIDHGLQFDLYVRRGTTLSRQLQEAIGLGQINRKYIP